MSKKEIKIITVQEKNYLVVGNEGFDWDIEPTELDKMRVQIKNDPYMKENFIGSIFKNLTDCFSQFIGKNVTLKEMNELIEKGFIE
jgi:hypothetical protein